MDADAYRQWRDGDLVRQLKGNFDVGAVAGKDVLDFGCGGGSLAFYLAEIGARSVFGVDLSAECIERAREHADSDRVRFELSGDPERIPCGDESCDLICCFDVMEHVMCPGAVMREWRRVLRPGGQVWIWWSPWRHPYGHHMNSLVPLPWVHILFDDRTISRVASRVYDDPSYIPRLWDIDEKTGKKKVNRWKEEPDFSGWLNKLTLRQFKMHCGEAGLSCRIRPEGFGGTGARRLVGSLAGLPMVGEFLTAFYAVVLTKETRHE